MAVVLTVWLPACSRPAAPDAIDAKHEATLQMIDDSVAVYNVGWAMQKIHSEMDSIGGDSLYYYRLLMFESTCHYLIGNPDSVLALGQRVEAFVGREPSEANRKLLKSLYTMRGAVYTQYYSQPDSAIAYQQRALDLVDQSDTRQLLLAYNNLADAYKFAGRLPQAVATYQQAVLTSDSLGVAPADQLLLFLGIASCYTDLRNFERSTFWWDKAESYRDHFSKNDILTYYNNRGSDYFYQKKYDKALEMFLTLDSICRTSDAMNWDLLLCHVNLADVYLKLRRPDDAAPLIEETSNFFNQQGNEAVMSYLYTQQMDLARQKGDYATADHLIAAHPMPEGIRHDQAVLRLDFLRDYYTERGDARNALHYTQLYQQLEDSLRDERVRQVTEELQIRHDRDETVLQQRLTISDKDSHLVRLYALVGATVLIVLLLLVWMRLQAVNRRNAEQRLRDNIVNMRMENIRNRITPHFIYNALNHEVSAQRQGKPTQMPVLVNLLRRAQMLASDFWIPLSEELEFIDLYLTVERNASGPINYSLNIAPGIDIRKVMIPSMTIQIFVENAIKHAFRLMPPEAARNLTIDVTRADGCTHIIISNTSTAVMPARSNDSTGTGMRIIFQTIQMLNERNREKIDIDVASRRDADGEPLYVVSLSIPDGFDFSTYNK